MKLLKGKVISTKMQKTATVSVDSTFMHRLYKKRYTISKKYLVHNEMSAVVGDEVTFIASRPYSKMKKWKIVKITDSGKKEKKDAIRVEEELTKAPKKSIKTKSKGKEKKP